MKILHFFLYMCSSVYGGERGTYTTNTPQIIYCNKHNQIICRKHKNKHLNKYSTNVYFHLQHKWSKIFYDFLQKKCTSYKKKNTLFEPKFSENAGYSIYFDMKMF